MEPPSNVVEARPQHPHVAVDSGSGEVAGAAAILQSRFPKPDALKSVHLSAATLAPVVEKPQDIHWQSQSERGSRRAQRWTDGTDRQKLLKVSPEMILLPCILCVADVRAQDSKPLVKVVALSRKKGKDNNNKKRDRREGPA